MARIILVELCEYMHKDIIACKDFRADAQGANSCREHVVIPMSFLSAPADETMNGGAKQHNAANPEETLFRAFTEFILLSELRETLTDDQVVNIVESVCCSFDALSVETITRFRNFLRCTIAREKSRGATKRAAILSDILAGYETV